MALLKGLLLLAISGVSVPPTRWSSAASSSESMLRLLSLMPQAEPLVTLATGVAATTADRYRSCSTDEVVVSADVLVEVGWDFNIPITLLPGK